MSNNMGRTRIGKLFNNINTLNFWKFFNIRFFVYILDINKQIGIETQFNDNKKDFKYKIVSEFHVSIDKETLYHDAIKKYMKII
jgi:hypothetical protein